MVVGADDVWATGDGPFYGENGGKVSGLSEHWDGRKWAVLPLVYSSGLGGGVTFEVTFGALAATATNDIWAVGYDTFENSYVVHWNGHAWQDIKHVRLGTASRRYGRSLRSLATMPGSSEWRRWSTGTASVVTGAQPPEDWTRLQHD